MNRLAFGAGLLVLAPVLSGCATFYIVNPPPPEPTATPAPTPITWPFDPAAGSDVSKAIKLNGTPTTPFAFRVSDRNDIQLGVRRANDRANATLLLVLQPINPAVTTTSTTTTTSSAPGTASAATTTASTTYVGGVKDRNPYHLAGIIVPGPAGRVGAGVQDADEQALLAEASRRMTDAVASWVRLYETPTVVAGATPLPTPTPTPRPRPGVVVRGTPIPTPAPLIDPKQFLDVYQDPQFPIDSENRPLVQVMFKSKGGNGIAADTPLSLNRMLVRSGWAVVDLYSPTSFDQQTWLLDEAYARHRRLGLWGLELNGKKLVLQQRVPAPSTGTGVRSNIPVTNNVAPRAGAPVRPTTPSTSATQVPATLTPTIAPSLPRVTTGSGSTIVRGPAGSVKLPPPSAGAAPATGTATAGSPSGVTGNTATGSG